jgi:hypothetical protein
VVWPDAPGTKRRNLTTRAACAKVCAVLRIPAATKQKGRACGRFVIAHPPAIKMAIGERVAAEEGSAREQ